MHRKLWLVGLVLAGLAAAPATAAVKTHSLFGDNMVLQRQLPVPVWGTADDGEAITVTIQDKLAKTVAKDGKWMVRLEDLKPGGPYEMTVAGKSNTLTIKNVLVGEVWLCSGQSNMQWSVNQSADPDKAKAAAANPQIRLYTVPRRGIDKPQDDIAKSGNAKEASWLVCSPEDVGAFSAVAFHFGVDLQKALDMPVGLISTNYGGTPAEAWTKKEVLEGHPDLKVYMDLQRKAFESYPQLIKAWEKAAADAKAKGEKPPAAPANPATRAQAATNLYNAMIAPLVPYAFRGVIWYQGESNAGQPGLYEKLFPAMIKNWRDDWKQGDFPFLFVQLAPYSKAGGDWPRLREAQLKTMQTVPNTAMAVITDIGAVTDDIHPKNKQPVGARLALGARALAYGHGLIEYAGPIYDRLTVDGGKAVLSFTHVGKGLEVKGDKLTGMLICGEDKKFVPAEARIDGDKVVVWSEQVAKPTAVRFGWDKYPTGNLFNKDGLPATPFRTDDFPPETTAGK